MKDAERVESDDAPSNEKLLCNAFVSFMVFALVQTFVALMAKSKALMGDSAAMMVDALTYLINWYAERQKRFYLEASENESIGELEALQQRKHYLHLELLPPLVSVSTLLVVIGFVLQKAIHILILDASRDASLQSNPNVKLMMIFSFFNLLLDVLNVHCFSRASHAFGYDINTGDDHESRAPPERLHPESMQGLLSDDETDSRHSNDDDDDAHEVKDEDIQSGKLEPLEIDDNSRQANHKASNLNMCSAYTHVFADTLRSLAVILASLLAVFVPAITPEVADASAAVVVSVLILASLVPLAKGMFHSLRELRKVNDLLIDGLFESSSFGDEDIDSSDA